VLFREGDRSYDFIVILTGSVTVLDHEAGEQRDWRPAARATSWPSLAS
jgi:hypothetical protein